MKKWSIFFLVCLVASVASASVKLTGTVGKYKITMELVASTASEDYNVRGRYQYAGKTQYLDVQGNMFGSDVMQLTESFEGKTTGDFYLERSDNGTWKGKWIGNSRYFDSELTVTSGSTSELEPYDLSDYHARTNSALTGSYVHEAYWVNDMFFSEDSPNLEVGFNGGVVTVKELSKDKIEFNFELVCGPTYHMAYLSGVAERVAPNEYHYKASPLDDGEICEVHFKFADKHVDLSQHTDNLSCGFGARAYADGSFMKVNNAAIDSDDGEMSIDMIIGKK